MIDNPNLLAFLQQEEMRARDTSIEQERAAMVGFYGGDPYGDEEDGRSQIVARDVAEAIDPSVVNLLKTMMGGDKICEFEDCDNDGPQDDEAAEGQQQQMPQQPPQGAPQGQQPGMAPQAGPDGQPMPPAAPMPPKQNPIGYAQQATEAVHYIFFKKNNGYRLIHDAGKAGLLEKTGWVKIYAEPQPPKMVEHIVPAELLHTLDVKKAEPVDPNNDQGLYRVVVAEPQPPKFCLDAVPNEEMLVASDVRELNRTPYIAHATRKTESDLRKMGYDPDEIGGGTDQTYLGGTLSQARDYGRGASDYWHNDRTGPMRQVWLLEEYTEFDIDGDGIAELVKIHRVGSTILSIEEMDEHPFEYWCPFPMQHRLVGQSLGDKVADIQRTNTVLMRNAFDALYISVSPRTYVHEGSIGPSTIDDLLTVRPNSIVRWKGSVEPRVAASTDTSATAFQAIEFMHGQRESRTGITRLNKGLDADTLNTTASGQAQLMDRGDAMQEYVARNFMEMLVAPMFGKLYRLMRKHGQPFPMKIDGQLVQVDPRQWPDEMDINIRVGLGSGRKEQRLLYRQQLLGIQQQAIMSGSTLVTQENIYNNLKGLIKDASLGDPGDYITDPATAGPQAPPPNPAVMKVQMEAQLAAQKQQHDQQMLEAAHSVKAAHAESDIQIKGAKAQQDANLADQSAAFQANLADKKFAAEMALNQQKLTAQIQLDQMRHEHEASMASLKLSFSQDRPGGNLDE
jgi:hypothetical protein